MKRRNLLIFLGLLIAFPSLAYSQPIPPFDKLFERWGLRIHPSDLRVLQLEISPDPVLEGQRIRFEATISNLSHFSTRWLCGIPFSLQPLRLSKV